MDEFKSGEFKISQGAMDRLRDLFASGRVSEDETSATIAALHARTGEVLCPHTAVAVNVAEAHLSGVPMISLATAHPAKFPAAVQDACGIHPDLPERMGDLFGKDERFTVVPNDLAALKALVKERIV